MAQSPARLLGAAAPGLTAPDRLRFDAAMAVPPGTSGDGRVRVGELPAYRCAVTTHVGAYATLPEAYPRIFEQSWAIAPNLAGLPVIEIYDDQNVDTGRAVSRTEVHLPIAGLCSP